MATIRTVYAREPSFPATDQHPDAKIPGDDVTAK